MVGHGQIEGFTEKYGMEYRKAYWDEEVDTEFIQNHERLIFPLIRNRSLFADNDRFYLFDFYSDEGFVDEDVFAYTNGDETQTVMVVYHNRFKYTSGKIITSTVFPQVIDGEKFMVSKNIYDVLQIPANPDAYLVFRDFYTNLDFLVPCLEVIQNGFSLKLNPYHCHVFVNFHVVYDGPENPYRLLYQQFQKQGFEDIEIALKELVYQAILSPFNLLVNQKIFENLIELQTKSIGLDLEKRDHFLEQFEENLISFLNQSVEFIRPKPGSHLPEKDTITIAQDTRNSLEAMLNIPVLINDMVLAKDKRNRKAIDYFTDGPGELTTVKYGNPKFWVTIYAYLVIDALGRLFGEEDAQQNSLKWMGNWMLDRKIVEGLRKMGIDDWNSRRCILVTRMMFRWNQDDIKSSQLETDSTNWVRTVVDAEESRLFLNVNTYEGATWFNKENYEELVWWWYSTSLILRFIRSEALEISDLINAYQVVTNLNRIKTQSNYQVNNLGVIDTGQDSS